MPIPSELVARHRDALAATETVANRDLVAVWRTLDLDDARAVTTALLPVVRDLTASYSDVAAVLAADFYDEAREAAGAPGTFRATSGPIVPAGQSDALVRWAVTPLWSTDPRYGAALRQLAAGSGRLIRQAGHDTVTASAVADPQSTGWQRHTRTGACKFCRMLAGRGAVYSEDTVRFAAHDNCHCTAAPSWEPGTELDVIQFVASKRTQTAADRQRVRDWMRENLDD